MAILAGIERYHKEWTNLSIAVDFAKHLLLIISMKLKQLLRLQTASRLKSGPNGHIVSINKKTEIWISTTNFKAQVLTLMDRERGREGERKRGGGEECLGLFQLIIPFSHIFVQMFICGILSEKVVLWPLGIKEAGQTRYLSIWNLPGMAFFPRAQEERTKIKTESIFKLIPQREGYPLGGLSHLHSDNLGGTLPPFQWGTILISFLSFSFLSLFFSEV